MTVRSSAVAILALAAALALALAACGGSGDPGDATSSGGIPVKGGTLRVAFHGEPTGLDPALAWETQSFAIERLTYQTFLTYASEPGEAGAKLVPDLATAVPTTANGGISANGKVYTFRLKRGVRFAPPVNREVTAADFKWSFERMMGTPLAPATFFYTGIVGAQDFIAGKADGIDGFKAINAHTVQITLERPNGAFLMAMSMPFTSVLPQEWVEKVGEQINRRPLGTGPYVIEKWTPGQGITAVRNRNWTGDTDQWVDAMELTFSADPSTALLKLERGEIDVLGDSIPADDYRRIADDSTWSKHVVDATQISWYYVFMNVREEPFDDVKVRQAVNYAIDTDKIEKLLGGQGSALNQIYPSGMPGREDDKTFYTHDPAKAKALLAEAGFSNGFATTLYSHNVEPFPKLAESIQADLEAVGIEVEIKKTARAAYWDFIGLQESHAGIGLSDWYQDFPDPSAWIGPLFTNPTDGGANASFYESDAVSDLYAQAAVELDPAKRIELFSRMQDVIMADAPTAPLFQPSWNGMYGQHTGGFFIHPVWVLSLQDYWKTNGK